MSQWRDMKTAPRDGTRILLGRSSRVVKRKVCIGRYNELIEGAQKWVLETSTYHRDSEFMGWMPLPSIYLADTWPSFIPSAALSQDTHSLPPLNPPADEEGAAASSGEAQS